MSRTVVYKGVAVTIHNVEYKTHLITLSVTNTVRHKNGSYNDALTYAIKWIDSCFQEVI